MKHTSAILALFALATSGVAGFGYGGYRLFRPTSVVLTPSYRKQANLLKKCSSGYSCPRYELTDNDEKFQVAIDVPGVTMDGITVNLEDDGKVLTIAGERKSNTDRYHFNSKFSQSFTIDPAVDIDKFTATLQNGVLIVAAPKDMKRIEANIRQIPITSFEESGPVATDEIKEQSKEDDVVEAAKNDIKDEEKPTNESDEKNDETPPQQDKST